MAKTFDETVADLVSDARKILAQMPDKAHKIKFDDVEDADFPDDAAEIAAGQILHREDDVFVVSHAHDIVVAGTVAAMLEWFAEAPGAAGATKVE